VHANSLQQVCASPSAAVRLIAGLVVAAAALVTIGCKRPEPPPHPIPQVGVTEVIQKDVPIYEEWIGTTDGFVNAQIRPKVSGYLLKQDYKDGDSVQQGQLLFEIDPREYKAALDQALANLAQQQAQNKKNQDDLARYTPLYREAVVSQQTYDNAVQAARGSDATVKAALAAVEAAKLNLEWTKVTSLIRGIAEIANAQVGDLVSTSTLLTTVSQVDPIKVTFPISEREYLRYADRIKKFEESGAPKQDRQPSDEPVLQMILADGHTYELTGSFYAAGKQVDLQTGTIRMQATFPNPDYTLRPGLYAKVRAAPEIRKNALLVPQRAVLETQGQFQVAVVGPDYRVTLRSVKLGPQIDTFRIIDNGLKPGERVVTEGQQKVADGMQVMPRLEAQPQSPSIDVASPAHKG
jgi:RND family efflux transporter MFP subunit